ncbi:hypothetical protein DES53_102238 [Roseimicrobium gellanilyticum]|uniref:Uncharacterized protein n=1 Tax=Roseimicrobium gellanilyticum TaxID=748857 RepID=A0A366HQA8_9BACT|nr:hypothetical protein [Roseimicrobium gellanilyticum]RBP45855.1 hypothetical protein DES53_102238 [Roseimicrobium gellanilyticum]
MKAQPASQPRSSRRSFLLCLSLLATGFFIFASSARAEDYVTLVYPSASTEVRVAEGEVIEIVTLHYDTGFGDQTPQASDKIPCMRVVRGYANALFDVPVMIKHQANGGRFLIAGPALVSFLDVAKPATLLVTYRSFSCHGGDHDHAH